MLNFMKEFVSETISSLLLDYNKFQEEIVIKSTNSVFLTSF